MNEYSDFRPYLPRFARCAGIAAALVSGLVYLLGCSARGAEPQDLAGAAIVAGKTHVAAEKAHLLACLGYREGLALGAVENDPAAEASCSKLED